LARLDIPRSEHVLLGLDRPDDAAVIRPPDGRPVTLTTDFFAAPLDDAYTVGRIAAINAASDVFAMGAKPIAALAMATIPPGPARQQEQYLYELLAGGLREFRAMGATLVGGHTIEGPQLTIGYTVVADQGSETALTKGRLRVGDLLVLTKPLGTGVLLAAHMRAMCRAAWMQPLLDCMLGSNQRAAEAAAELGVMAITDITGFGLAGHMLEMLRASDLAAELDLAQVPLLPGAAELIGQGVESTLAPGNRDIENEIHTTVPPSEAAYQALFDPQTSGGLLIGIAPTNAEKMLARLAEASDLPAAIIGRVLEHESGGPRIRVK
jgi:selenide,water dikinase